MQKFKHKLFKNIISSGEIAQATKNSTTFRLQYTLGLMIDGSVNVYPLQHTRAFHYKQLDAS